MPQQVQLLGGPQDGAVIEMPWDARMTVIDGGVYQPVTMLDHLKRVWRWWS